MPAPNPTAARATPPAVWVGGLLALGLGLAALAADPPLDPVTASGQAEPLPAERYTQTGHFPEETADADGDGVPDIDDNCPNTERKPALVTPTGTFPYTVDNCGCPVDPCSKDSDNDGVNDCQDACPNTYAGHRVGDNGCPLPIEEHERVKLDVKFEFDRAEIDLGFEQDLEKVRNLLLRYPEVGVTLEGHTDWKGSDAYNQRLSEQRANACRTFLLKDSRIAPERVKAVGYGESRPVADNETEQGQALNRRTVAELTGGRTIIPVNEEPPPLQGLGGESGRAPAAPKAESPADETTPPPSPPESPR